MPRRPAGALGVLELSNTVYLEGRGWTLLSRGKDNQMALETLEFLFGLVLLIFVGGLGFLILIKIIDKTINLSRLISKPNSDASMSRFQFLIFTFVIALSL